MATYTGSSDIMNVREIIDTAFGDFEGNAVNFKLIQTVLYLLARQLRFLERRVRIEIGPQYSVSSGSSIQVTEVKIRAKSKKPKQDTKNAAPPRKSIDKGGKRKSIGRSGLSPPESPDKLDSEKTKFEKAPTDGTAQRKDSPDKSATKKGTTDRSTREKPSTGISTTSSDKSLLSKKQRKGKEYKESNLQEISESEADESKTTSRQRKERNLEESEDDKQKSSMKTDRDKKEDSEKPVKASDRAKRKTLDPEYYDKLVDDFETQREAELRIIHQRAYSYEEQYKTPTPIASIDSTEAQYEKLLVVERVPSEEAKARMLKDRPSRTPQLSIVTQEQFEELVKDVRKLQDRFGPIGMPGFPDNAQLLGELRRGASLTDAMAALQLSARLEATEKALQYMIGLVTDIARNIPGMEIITDDDTRNLFGTDDIGKAPGTGVGRDGERAGIASRVIGDVSKPSSQVAEDRKAAFDQSPQKLKHEADYRTQTVSSDDESITVQDSATLGKKYVTYAELRKNMKNLETKVTKIVTEGTGKSISDAEKAFKSARNLELRLDSALNLGSRMDELEALVHSYAEQINTLDTGLTSQITNYQEQLTQMQNDLEIGLETMTEVLADSGGDSAAISELNSNFTSLQTDFDAITTLQRELKESQTALGLDLEGLWKEIEILRAIKSDRDEVVDALRDKAGIAQLNGLVSLEHFEAVRCYFEKQIASAYDKFNNQEIIWQKAIDDLVREIDEKADRIEITSLRSEISRYLNIMKARMQFIADIVGEPKAAALSKKLFRDAACLSCGSPAVMDIEGGEKVSALPEFHTRKQKGERTDKQKPNGDGDHRPCIPGFVIPHPRDPRSHVCQRYCGGSHTLIPNISQVPPSIEVQAVEKPVSFGEGTDGKMYAIDNQQLKKPCLPCNIKRSPELPPESKELESSMEKEVANETVTLPEIQDLNIESNKPALVEVADVNPEPADE